MPRRVERARERQHRRQRQSVVQPGLEVERVPDHARDARVGHDARRQHGVGRREERSDQEALRPREVGEDARRQRHENARDRHRQQELAKGRPPLSPEQLALHLEPVAEQDHHEGNDRHDLDEVGRRRGLHQPEPAVLTGPGRIGLPPKPVPLQATWTILDYKWSA